MNQFQPNVEALKALSFVKSPVWDFVQEVLNASIQAEVAIAISQTVTPDVRAHAAGRAEGLVDLQNYLSECRQEAIEKHKVILPS